MKIRPENETVDRSRLKLLGALAAASASGGCNQTVPYLPGSSTEASKKYPKDREETPGGEGGGGGSH